MNKRYVKGFVTNVGGRTSHSSIMAQSLEIPANVGVKGATQTIQNGDEVIVDGMSGNVWLNPTEDIRRKLNEQQKKLEKEKLQLTLLKDDASVTKDHYKVELLANIGSPKDVEQVIKNGAEGIGLFRTEFLYMERTSLPTEEEQFEVYKKVLEKMDEKPVVVRTIDIGGDKHLSYWTLPQELNPFLGVRAIRLALQEIDVFRTQLRAMLRASTFGNIKIMFPMIATLDEFRKAKQIVLEEKLNLVNEGVGVREEIEIGIMVETPVTALFADQFAKEVDFFSIGTNDLIQYTFAVDRMNEQVAYLYQPFHPAILQLVKNVIEAAHKEGKWAGMCGEMAGDSVAIPLLLGLGLDEFSMSASSILKARSQIKQLNKAEMEQLAQKALTFQTSDEVVALVKKETEI